jgi:hypothetical protein
MVGFRRSRAPCPTRQRSTHRRVARPACAVGRRARTAQPRARPRGHRHPFVGQSVRPGDAACRRDDGGRTDRQPATPRRRRERSRTQPAEPSGRKLVRRHVPTHDLARRRIRSAFGGGVTRAERARVCQPGGQRIAVTRGQREPVAEPRAGRVAVAAGAVAAGTGHLGRALGRTGERLAFDAAGPIAGRHTEARRHAEAGRPSDAATDDEAEADAEGDAFTDTEADAEGDPEANPEAHTEGNCRAHPDADVDD